MKYFLKDRDGTPLEISVAQYQGCALCPVREECYTGKLHTSVLLMRHIGNEQWDNWGRITPVFRLNDEVNVTVMHDDKQAYCGSAISTIYADEGISDFVSLDNFELIYRYTCNEEAS